MKQGETTMTAEKNFRHTSMHSHNGNIIDPTAIIGENVILGKNNFIGAYCYIHDNTIIGNNNVFHSYCSIGSEAEHRDFWDKPKKFGVEIWDNCVFREFTTVNAGTDRNTLIQDDVIMLKGAHVGHDSVIMRNATLSCNVVIGGHSLIGIFVNMGIGSVCHQRSYIPHYCMIGMNSTITKSFNEIFKSFKTYVGSPVKCIGDNTKFIDLFTKRDVARIHSEFLLEVVSEKQMTENERNRSRTIERYEGKKLLNIETEEEFYFKGDRDWEKVFNHPERFQIIFQNS